MKSQNEIITETEMVVEQCRQDVAQFKAKITDSGAKKCCLHLENILFEIVIMFYTHRTVWSQPEFWGSYADTASLIDFSNSAYNQMLLSTLGSCYLKLYFCIEGSLFYYLSLKNIYSRNNNTIEKMYSKLKKAQLPNYDEIQKGLHILKYVRNSFHGNDGNYIFSYQDEEVYFKNKKYLFKKGEPTSVSYDFLRDFLPSVNELHKSLFETK